MMMLVCIYMTPMPPLMSAMAIGATNIAVAATTLTALLFAVAVESYATASIDATVRAFFEAAVLGIATATAISSAIAS